MMRLFATAILAVAILFGPMAYAGPASERVFSTTALDGLMPGHQAVYAHTRQGTVTGDDALQPLDNGEIRVALQTGDDGNREAAVTMGEAGKLKPVSIWPAASGNPILPIFLESALRAMAQTTGGSSFYIRNRIKEALGTGGTMTGVEATLDGEPIQATEIVFAPFTNDKNRARMGPFAGLTLTFVVSDQMPGDIVRFVAATPPGADGADAAYREEIVFSTHLNQTGE